MKGSHNSLKRKSMKGSHILAREKEDERGDGHILAKEREIKGEALISEEG